MKEIELVYTTTKKQDELRTYDSPGIKCSRNWEPWLCFVGVVAAQFFSWNICHCREESLRNAEAKVSRRQQKKMLRVQKVESKIVAEQPAFSPTRVISEPCKTVKEINAENAAKRLAIKSNEHEVVTNRRDKSEDDRTVFVGNVPLSVTKKVCVLRSSQFFTCSPMA